MRLNEHEDSQATISNKFSNHARLKGLKGKELQEPGRSTSARHLPHPFGSVGTVKRWAVGDCGSWPALLLPPSMLAQYCIYAAGIPMKIYKPPIGFFVFNGSIYLRTYIRTHLPIDTSNISASVSVSVSLSLCIACVHAMQRNALVM
jgi:hypothetical protein